MPNNQNKSSILLCQIHCAFKKIYSKVTCSLEHAAICANPCSGVIVEDGVFDFRCVCVMCVCVCTVYAFD